MDQSIKEIIKKTIKKEVPTTSKVQDQGFIQQFEECKYYYVITSFLWYKVRIFQIWCVKLDKNEPLYWVVNKCGTSYLKSSLKCYDVKFVTVDDQMHLIIFNHHYESQHLTKDMCYKKIDEVQKQFEQKQTACSNHSLCNKFNNIYLCEQHHSKESIQKINTELCIQHFEKEISEYFNLDLRKFEGFVANRKTLVHKGIEYEYIEFVICYIEYKVVTYVESNGGDEESFSGPYLIEEDIRKITHKIVILNSKLQRNNEGNITQRQFIQIYNRNFSELLSNQQYKELFTDHKHFYDNFVNKIQYKEGRDFQKNSPTLPFQSGSVLRVDRGLFFHAAVFIKLDLVIHIKIDQKNSQGQIFNFDRFDNFIKESKNVEEIRFNLTLFTPEEILERALEMNRSHYDYKLDEQNCEHVSFELVTDLKFSPQTFNSVKKTTSTFLRKLFS